MVAQSAQHRAKIAAGLRAYHKTCKGVKRKVVKKRVSVFKRLVDNRPIRAGVKRVGAPIPKLRRAKGRTAVRKAGTNTVYGRIRYLF